MEGALPFQNEVHIPFGSLARNAPFVESPISVLREACRLLQIEPGEVVYDLGCGTGDFLMQVVTQIPQVRAFGIDIAEDLVGIANERYRHCTTIQEGSSVTCEVGDVLEETADWVFKADKIFMYLVPRMLRLSKFQSMLHKFLWNEGSEDKPRILVCYHYSIPGWKPDYVDKQLRLFLYTKHSFHK
eukprot:TRINITY_DN5680_c0_g1_i1.p1 TRINITY_DN5680_c0_g1~~TRINITY_DN5680_c0_g1_i1.p1  ORF type:complete len:186 (+),score=30.87 TRINITY_DN5680_c0_g1_i1:38-595(+)